jgi:hypothetical protein
MKIREKRAKVAGTRVIADGKFQLSRKSREEVTLQSPEMPEGWNFPSAIPHVPASFSRFSLIFVPSLQAMLDFLRKPKPNLKELHAAFRTIITMLHYFNTPNKRLHPDWPGPGEKGPLDPKDDNEKQELRELDALSALLIRKHEITAVVADWTQHEVFASVIFPNNCNAEPLVQSKLNKSWKSKIISFTASMNPRTSPNDIVMNDTLQPIIVECDSKHVPSSLAVASHSRDNAASLLDNYLAEHL